MKIIITDVTYKTMTRPLNKASVQYFEAARSEYDTAQ